MLHSPAWTCGAAASHAATPYRSFKAPANAMYTGLARYFSTERWPVRMSTMAVMPGLRGMSASLGWSGPGGRRLD